MAGKPLPPFCRTVNNAQRVKRYKKETRGNSIHGAGQEGAGNTMGQACGAMPAVFCSTRLNGVAYGIKEEGEWGQVVRLPNASAAALPHSVQR